VPVCVLGDDMNHLELHCQLFVDPYQLRNYTTVIQRLLIYVSNLLIIYLIEF